MFLIAPVGRWRTQLVLRGFGFAMAVRCLTILNGRLCNEGAFDYVFQISGLVLLLLGARLITLVPVLLACSWNLYRSLFEFKFPAAENVNLVLISVTAVLVLIVSLLHARAHWQGSERSASDRLRAADQMMISCLRIALVVTMVFVAIHKMNADFFNPEVSCATRISALMDTRSGPIETALLKQPDLAPIATVTAESGIAVLSVLAPGAGMILAATFMTPLALWGAGTITSLTIVLSWAFLRERDARVLRQRWRLIAASSLVIYSTLLAYLFTLTRYGFKHFLVVFALLVVVTSVVGAVVLHSQLREILAARRPGAGFARQWLLHCKAITSIDLPSSTGLRVLLIVFVLICLGNSASPYFGYKFQYSGAMWSNLRTDAERWNSYVVPSALRIFEEDRVVVEAVHKGRGLIAPGSYSPYHFRKITRPLLSQDNRRRTALEFRFRGVAHEYRGPRDREELRDFIQSLPIAMQLFQKALRLRGPQRCVH